MSKPAMKGSPRTKKILGPFKKLLNLETKHVYEPQARLDFSHSATDTASDLRERAKFFQVLPPDLWLVVLYYSSTESFVNFAATCRQARCFLGERSIWMQQLLNLDDYHFPNVPPYVRLDELATATLKSLVLGAVRSYRNWHNPAGPHSSENIMMPGYAFIQTYAYDAETIDILPGCSPERLRVLRSQWFAPIDEATLRLEIAISELPQYRVLWKHAISVPESQSLEGCTWELGFEAICDDVVMLAYAMTNTPDKRLIICVLKVELKGSSADGTSTQTQVAKIEIQCTDDQYPVLLWNTMKKVLIHGEFVVVFSSRLLFVVNWETGDVLELASPGLPLSSCKLVDGHIICVGMPESSTRELHLIISRLKSLFKMARLRYTKNKTTIRGISFPLISPYATVVKIAVPFLEDPTDICIRGFRQWGTRNIKISMVLSYTPTSSHRCSEFIFSTKDDISGSNLSAEVPQLSTRHSRVFVVHDKEKTYMHRPVSMSASGRILVGRSSRSGPVGADPGMYSFADAMNLQGDRLEIRLTKRRPQGAVRRGPFFEHYSGAVCSSTLGRCLVEWFD